MHGSGYAWYVSSKVSCIQDVAHYRTSSHKSLLAVGNQQVVQTYNFCVNHITSENEEIIQFFFPDTCFVGM